MKKLIALLLALCMLLTMAACAAKETPAQSADKTDAPAQSNDSTQSSEPAKETTDAPADSFTVESTKEWNADAPTGFKVGFAYLPPSDTLGAAFHKMLDYAAAEFGCEMFYVEWTAFDSEALVGGYENMIQAGCDAIIPVMMFAAVIEACNNAGVYYLPTCCEVTEEVLPLCLESDYYLGNIHEDEVISGYTLAQNLYDAGCRNVCFKGTAPGSAKSHDDRYRGFMQFVDEHEDFNLVAEALDSSSTTIFEELIAAHGTKIDGFAASGGDAKLPAAIISAGYEDDIKYTTIDIQGDVRTDLELGMCVGVAGGQYPSMELSFLVIYNALATGEKVIVDRTQSLKRGYMWLRSVDDYDYYITYMEGEIPAYTGDELKEMSLAHNPEATVDSVWQQLQDYCASYSLEEVIARHAEYYN